MHQILLIFRKDCRKLWPEILLVVALSAAFAGIYPYQWRSADDVPGGFLDINHLQQLASFLTGLLPFGWFLLITRVVQEENLVGNRQFWVTRPYRWQLLLTEKLLFLLVTLFIPFFAAQAALLAQAGFKPFHYVPGILYNLACVGLIVLALFALATIVRTVFRSFGVLLAFAAIIAAAAFFATSYDESALYVPYTERAAFLLALAFCAAAVLVQYSTRRLWVSRGLLIAGLVTFTVLAASPLDSAIFAHIYQPNFEQRLFQVGYGNATSKGLSASPRDNRHVDLQIPITVASIPYGYEVSPDDVRVHLTPADGGTLVSTWQASYNHNYTMDFPYDTVSVQVDKQFYERLAGKPVDVDVDLAITQLEAGQPARYLIPDSGELNIPNFGICRLQPASGFMNASLACREPLRQPTHSRVVVSGSSAPCDSGAGRAPDDRYSSNWTGELLRDAADFGLTSVWTSSIMLNGTGASYARTRATRGLHVCPGSSVTITRYHVTHRFVQTLHISKVELSPAAVVPYRLND